MEQFARFSRVAKRFILSTMLVLTITNQVRADWNSYHQNYPAIPRYEYTRREPIYTPPAYIFLDGADQDRGRGNGYADAEMYVMGANALMAYGEARKGSADYTGDPITDLIAMPFRLPGAIFGVLFGGEEK